METPGTDCTTTTGTDTYLPDLRALHSNFSQMISLLEMLIEALERHDRPRAEALATAIGLLNEAPSEELQTILEFLK